LAKPKSSSKKLSRQKYQEALGGVQLEGLVLDECSAELRREKLLTSTSRSLTLAVSDEPRVQAKSDHGFIIEQKYKLVAKPSNERAYALRLTCKFVLTYSSDGEVSDQFLEIFTSNNVSLNSWPYFRELVQNLTQRMGMPPLTVPLLK